MCSLLSLQLQTALSWNNSTPPDSGESYSRVTDDPEASARAGESSPQNPPYVTEEEGEVKSSL